VSQEPQWLVVSTEVVPVEVGAAEELVVLEEVGAAVDEDAPPGRHWE